jgi:hypothetical protein
MSYNFRTGMHFLKKGIEQSAPVLLLWALVTPFLLLLSFSALKRLSIGSLGEMCIGDYVNSLNSGYLMNLLVVPLTAAIIFIISEQDNTANCILKFHSRTDVLKNQYMKVLFLSVLFSVGLVFISFIIAGLLASSLMNWSEQASSFYQSHGYTLKIKFAFVQALTAYKIFIKLVLFLIIMILTNLHFKKIFSFLIMFILSAIRLTDLLQFEIASIFKLVKEKSYFYSSLKIVYLGVMPALIIIFIGISMKLVKRKDFIVS